jgi:hypothetical protein
LTVTGAVRLAGVLDLAAPAPAGGGPGAKVTVIDHRGKGRNTGAFAGLREGAEVKLADRTYRITYRGGDGNDVVLSRAKAGRSPVVKAATGPGADNPETRTRNASASAGTGLGWWPYALAVAGLCGLLVPVARRGKNRRRGGGRHAATG